MLYPTNLRDNPDSSECPVGVDGLDCTTARGIQPTSVVRSHDLAKRSVIDNVDRGKMRHAISSQPSLALTEKRRKRGAPVKVCITQHLGMQPLPLLAQVLEDAGFWTHIAQVRRVLRRRDDSFLIIIKPDLDFYDALNLGGTSPVLVEHLIDLLNDRGFHNIVVGDGRNEPDDSLHNRDPLVVPDLVGYRFATAKGRTYEVVDLQSAFPAPDRSAQGSFPPISNHWSNASYRINFAKNKTHEDCVFALCVYNLAGVVTAKNDSGAPQRRIAPEDCLEVLRRAPPHFNIIDAFTSSHGGAGHRAPRPMGNACPHSQRRCVAGRSGRCGQDGRGPLCLAGQCSIPPQYRPSAVIRTDGDLAPYPLWRNIASANCPVGRLRNRSDALTSDRRTLVSSLRIESALPVQ